MNKANQVEEKIRTYMQDAFMVEFGQDVTSATNLFKEGIMDSFGYIQLITFLESEFEITYSEDDMFTNVLVSLDSIVASVRLKLGNAV